MLIDVIVHGASKETEKTIEGLTDENQTRIVKSRENTPGGQKPTLILHMALRAVC